MLRAGRLFLLGALSFWGPEILLYAWKRRDLDSRVVTFLLPCCLLLSYFLATRLQWCKVAGRPSGAAFMLLGVWILGPTAMLIGATFQGAGFLTLGTGSALVTALLGLFPPYTFIMATYDGSLFGLIIASILMPVFHFVFERKSWIVPPDWTAYFISRKRII